MAVRLQLVPGREPPDLLGLPWAVPLAGWDHPRLVRMVSGPSRHVVRFVRDGERVYALKEMPGPDAEREYAMLRLLAAERLPAVEAVGLVSGRETAGGEPLPAMLVSRYLDYALPFHHLFSAEGVPGPGFGRRLVDAAVVLLVRLHLEGVFWGDCSLSNLLFRRDAGALMAYLVDAETAER
ncbi:MAG: lipopolysaccharide kinase InaA family protein, partial [Acidimicrobiia bacterium]